MYSRATADMEAYWDGVNRSNEAYDYAEQEMIDHLWANLPISDPMDLFGDWIIDNVRLDESDQEHYERFQDWAMENEYAYETNGVFRWIHITVTNCNGR